MKKAKLAATTWTAFKDFKAGKYLKHQWSKTTRNCNEQNRQQIM